MTLRVAMLSVHSCPLGRLGTRDTGGMSVYVRELARALGAQDVAVDIFTRQHSGCASDQMWLGAGVRLIHLPLPGSESRVGIYPDLPDFACAINQVKVGAGITYDIVHSHYWLSGYVGGILAGWWKVPHLTTLHTSARGKNHRLGWDEEPELRAETEQQVLAAADRVIATGHQEQDDLIAYYALPPEQVKVIPGGVDLELFQPRPREWARQRLGLTGARVVLFVGRVEPLKGVELLLKAFSLMNGRSQAQLVVVGGNPGEDEELERLRQLSRDWGLESRVQFLGTVPQPELPLYYSAADVCVLPSYYETFGLVALESLACGTPVIATPVGIAAEVIHPGENGLLLAHSSAAELAHQIVQILEDSGLRERLATQARATVSSFTWERVAREVAVEYDNLQGRKDGG